MVEKTKTSLSPCQIWTPI